MLTLDNFRKEKAAISSFKTKEIGLYIIYYEFILRKNIDLLYNRMF